MENTQKKSGSIIGLIILAVLIPVAGLIIGALKMSNADPHEKKMGESVLAWSILFMIIWGIGFFFIGQYLTDQRIKNAGAQAQIEVDNSINQAQAKSQKLIDCTNNAIKNGGNAMVDCQGLY